MKNRCKIVSYNVKSSRRMFREYGTRSGIEFAKGIFAKYRMRRKAGPIYKFIFRSPNHSLNTVQRMEKPSFFRNDYSIQLHFQAGRHYKAEHYLLNNTSNNYPAVTLARAGGYDRKLPEGYHGRELIFQKVTITSRNRILINRKKEGQPFLQPMEWGINLPKVLFVPDKLTGPASNYAAKANPAHQPVPGYYLSKVDTHPRQQPTHETLRRKQRAEKPNRIKQFSIMQFMKLTATRTKRIDQTVVSTEVSNTTSAKPEDRKLMTFPGKLELFYSSFPEATQGRHRVIVPGIKAESSETIMRRKVAYPKTEFVWRKPADSRHNFKIDSPATGAAQLTETITKAASVSEKYPAEVASKQVPDINSIVAVVLKSLDKRIAIERDKRGRR